MDAAACPRFSSERVRPSLLGALCTAVSAALRRLDSVQLPAAPRFADIAIWAVAAAPALGATEEAVLSALSSPAEFATSADPVAEALCTLMKDRASWTGTATELLALPHPPDNPLWPPTPSAFSRHVKYLAPSLSNRGLRVRFHRAHGGRRLIILEACEAS